MNNTIKFNILELVEVTTFILFRQFSFLGAEFPQKGYFPSKAEQMIIPIESSIFELV